MGKDYYNILGIDKSADDSTIKKAYRKLSKKYHPDVNPDGEDKFKEIAEAYDTLSDKDKRANYDRFGSDGPPMGGNPFGGRSMDDIMREFGFGGRGRRSMRGNNISVSVTLTLEDVLNGFEKTFKYRRNSKCEPCNGEGGFEKTRCSVCNGTGQYQQRVNTPLGVMVNMSDCHTCGTTGEVHKKTCTNCNGSGVKSKEEDVKVNIPRGVKVGDSLKYPGMGHAIKNGSSGDLIIKLLIANHDDYIRNGDDLKYNLKLNYSQLVLGDKVEVPTIEGGKIRVSIPKFSKVGDNLRIVNKGLYVYNSNYRGDMIIILDIDMPTELTENQEKIIKDLKKLGI
jgi:molecular chaperone DnaJ